ncbi:MAG: Ca-activated chloride channel family protein, partial [Verrucomicrobiales bacterium]
SLDVLPDGERSLRQRFLWLPPVLYFMGLAAIVCALARPQTNELATQEVHEGLAIMMLLDISSSMDMNTGSGKSRETRLASAKQVLEGFVVGDGEKLAGRPHDLIGLVTFARYADTVCPLTLSHDALTYITREIEVQDRPNEDGTAYGDATALAAAHLKTYETMQNQGKRSSVIPDIKSKIIVLLTDGENNCGNHLPIQSAAMAREWGIRVYTINFGELASPRSVETELGKVQLPDEMSATEATLRQMAEITGGIYRQAADAQSLRAVYAEIDELEKSQLKPVAIVQKNERFAPFAASSLVMLGLYVVLASTWLRRLP